MSYIIKVIFQARKQAGGLSHAVGWALGPTPSVFLLRVFLLSSTAHIPDKSSPHHHHRPHLSSNVPQYTQRPTRADSSS